MAKYIWQDNKWPNFTWRAEELQEVLSDCAFRYGRFLGRLTGIGFELGNQAGFETLSEEIVNSAAIEGEVLNREDVRSSVARRMEIAYTGAQAENHVLDARVEMILDATRGWDRAMSEERLKSWHAALFPTGYSGLTKLNAGNYRDDSEGPMQVVSRHGSLMRTHFEAPGAERLAVEMASFITWLNEDQKLPMLVKAALSHLRFLTIHPFEDGNGRLARALTEWVLARGEQSALRFYSLSSEIQREKNAYYEEIEHAQRNTMDVTGWIKWFLLCHRRALELADAKLEKILFKAEFWQRYREVSINDNQRRMLNALLDGFEGKMTSSKWAKICKVSQDTAGREIEALIKARMLERVGQARATHYVILKNPNGDYPQDVKSTKRLIRRLT